MNPQLTNFRQFAKQIESLVQQRNNREAVKLLKLIPNKHQLNQQHRIAIAEWWSRLGYYHKALKSLNPSQLSYLQMDKKELDEWLTYVKLLNNIGLSNYAQKISNKLCAFIKTDWQWYCVGQIYLTNFRYDQALTCFNKINPQNFPANKAALLIISKADCLCNMSKTAKAIDMVIKLKKQLTGGLLKAIADTALGEYYFKEGNLDLALTSLNSWTSFFKQDRQSVDYFLWCKWKGLIELSLGHQTMAQEYLDECESLLSRLKPEGQNDLLFWRWKLTNSTSDKEALFQKINLGPHYLSPHHTKELLQQKHQFFHLNFNGTNFNISDYDPNIYPPQILNRNLLIIDYIQKVLISNKKIRLANTLSLDLANIIGKSILWNGISKWRAIDLIYPDESLSYESLYERFKKVLTLCRQEYMAVTNKDHILLPSSPFQLISTNPTILNQSQLVLGQIFLRHHQQFNIKDMTSFLNIKKTKAYDILKIWMQVGSIVPLQVGKYASTFK